MCTGLHEELTRTWSTTVREIFGVGEGNRRRRNKGPPDISGLRACFATLVLEAN